MTPSAMAAAAPFVLIRAVLQASDLGEPGLRAMLEVVRMGQYTRITRAFAALACAGIQLRTCSRDALVQIPGIGMKTASYFILFSRRGASVASLDTHILAFMDEHRLAPNIPSSTPAGKRYLELEQVFIRHCDARSRDIAELDFEIWKARNRGEKRQRRRA